MIHALYIGNNGNVSTQLTHSVDSLVTIKNCIELKTRKATFSEIGLIIADKVQKGIHAKSLISLIRENRIGENIPVILLGDSFSTEERKEFLTAGFAELCMGEENLNLSIQLIQARGQKTTATTRPVLKSTNWMKRGFDILFSSTFLILSSPILLLIALAVRIDSKGPVIYKSKRVGHSYLVFDFLKFRTMKMNADHLVKDLMKQNQYKSEETQGLKVESTEYLIDSMGNTIDEETFITRKRREKAGSFFKVKNDPRITKVGRFLRATSLDELPQFINVLKGEMSIIGNRPLPLYEAELLTTDQWSARFLAPAGITGLWQVEKRGKSDMSEIERKELDNNYARNQSFWFDMRILARTIPALMQKENV